MTEENKYEGLGGWLILVGLGIIISPFKIIKNYLPLYLEFFSNDEYKLLYTPGTDYYIPGYLPLIYAELAFNSMLVAAWVGVGFLFFSKSRLFKRFYIGILLFTFFFILIDSLVFNLLFPEDPLFDKETLVELARTAIIIAIWVPYMMVSKRVKATFVK